MVKKYLFAVLLTLASVGVAQAENYPDRVIKIIVPTGPGGAYDLVARFMSDKLQTPQAKCNCLEPYWRRYYRWYSGGHSGAGGRIHTIGRRPKQYRLQHGADE